MGVSDNVDFGFTLLALGDVIVCERDRFELFGVRADVETGVRFDELAEECLCLVVGVVLKD